MKASFSLHCFSMSLWSWGDGLFGEDRQEDELVDRWTPVAMAYTRFRLGSPLASVFVLVVVAVVVVAWKDERSDDDVDADFFFFFFFFFWETGLDGVAVEHACAPSSSKMDSTSDSTSDSCPDMANDEVISSCFSLLRLLVFFFLLCDLLRLPLPPLLSSAPKSDV